MTLCPMCGCEDGMRSQATASRWNASHTPGHTANHICYALAEEKALFSGDHVMGWSTSVIAPPDGDMGQYLASLEKLTRAGRPDSLSHPWLAHHQPARLARAADRPSPHARGADSGGVARGREPRSPALVERLYPDIAPALRGAAAQQVKAHLDHLVEQGAVTRDGWRLQLEVGEEGFQPRDVAAVIVAGLRGFRSGYRPGCRWRRPGAPGSRCRRCGRTRSFCGGLDAQILFAGVDDGPAQLCTTS